MIFEFSIWRHKTLFSVSAVQESKEFKYKIKELEKKIRDMTNVIEEYPRDFEHSLLFHGIPVADKENFFTKAKVVSEIIR